MFKLASAAMLQLLLDRISRIPAWLFLMDKLIL